MTAFAIHTMTATHAERVQRIASRLDTIATPYTTLREVADELASIAGEMAEAEEQNAAWDVFEAALAADRSARQTPVYGAAGLV